MLYSAIHLFISPTDVAFRHERIHIKSIGYCMVLGLVRDEPILRTVGPPIQVAYLARSANLPEGLYILLALISFFFLFLMIARRTIISGSAGPIFAIFSPNESVLGAGDSSGPLFSISQGMLPWQVRNQLCGQMANSPHSSQLNAL